MVINYNKKVKELIDSGKKKEAIALTEEQIQLEPLNIRNYLILGQLFNNLNDYSGAEINFKKAYEIDSNNKDTVILH